MKVLVFIWVTVCLFGSYQHSVLPKEELCFLSMFVLESSALPSYFYEMMDDFDEINSKDEVVHTTLAVSMIRPTTTTTEAPIPNEWRQRAEYRVKCLEEVKVNSGKLVNLMKTANWEAHDTGVKQWVLCVLNKMKIMSAEGVYKLDVALAKIPRKEREEAEALIDFCLPKKQMAPTDIAWEYVKCFSNSSQYPTGNLSAINIF